MFSGNPKEIETIIEISHKGPFLAKVEDMKIEEIDDQSFESFDIIK